MKFKLLYTFGCLRCLCGASGVRLYWREGHDRFLMLIRGRSASDTPHSGLASSAIEHPHLLANGYAMLVAVSGRFRQGQLLILSSYQRPVASNVTVAIRLSLGIVRFIRFRRVRPSSSTTSKTISIGSGPTPRKEHATKSFSASHSLASIASHRFSSPANPTSS